LFGSSCSAGSVALRLDARLQAVSVCVCWQLVWHSSGCWCAQPVHYTVRGSDVPVKPSAAALTRPQLSGQPDACLVGQAQTKHRPDLCQRMLLHVHKHVLFHGTHTSLVASSTAPDWVREESLPDSMHTTLPVGDSYPCCASMAGHIRSCGGVLLARGTSSVWLSWDSCGAAAEGDHAGWPLLLPLLPASTCNPLCSVIYINQQPAMQASRRAGGGCCPSAQQSS
jgi:hypothetical protein